MLCRTIHKTLNHIGIKSPTLSFASRPLHKVKGHTNYEPTMTHGSRGVIGCRSLSSGESPGSRDPGDYSSDPQVKEWLQELQKDFSRQSEGKKEEELGAGKKEEEEDVGAERVKEGEKKEAATSKPHKVWTQLMAEKYKKLDSHTQIIYDYDEERLRREEGLQEEAEQQKKVQLERGETGVFDVEELVDLLREDNARDIVVIQIPPEMKYVSYMVIVSSTSHRHRIALAELVRAAYKMKKNKKDPSVITEGKGTDWVAMDMGNIALHIMKPETRKVYDLETLWAVGAEYDEKAQISENDLMTVRRPRDPLARHPPPPTPPAHTFPHPEAVM